MKVVGGNGKFSYSWNHSLGNTPGPISVSPDSTTDYILTVADGCGTPVARDTATVYVIQKPIGDILPYPDRGCAPFTVQLNTRNYSNTGLKYKWYIDDVLFDTVPNPLYTMKNPGYFRIKLDLINSVCTTTAKGDTAIIVWPKPEASFAVDPNTISIMGPPFYFKDRSSADAISWIWDFGDNTISEDKNPDHIYDAPGTYNTGLIVTNKYGCRDTAYNKVVIIPEFAFYIPNTFTPNGDGNNDVFSGKGIGIVKYQMDVFDRWGNHFFRTENLDKGWDGKIAGEMALNDVYVYMVTLWDFRNKKHEYTGHFNLVK